MIVAGSLLKLILIKLTATRELVSVSFFLRVTLQKFRTRASTKTSSRKNHILWNQPVSQIRYACSSSWPELDMCPPAQGSWDPGPDLPTITSPGTMRYLVSVARLPGTGQHSTCFHPHRFFGIFTRYLGSATRLQGNGQRSTCFHRHESLGILSLRYPPVSAHPTGCVGPQGAMESYGSVNRRRFREIMLIECVR